MTFIIVLFSIIYIFIIFFHLNCYNVDNGICKVDIGSLIIRKRNKTAAFSLVAVDF